MKKNVIIAILSLVFMGCVTEEGTTYNYTITNNSGVTVEIIPYTQQGELLLSKKIVLSNGQSIKKKVLGQLGRSPSISTLIWSNGGALTKVEFVFNSTKRKVYIGCGLVVNGAADNCDDTRNIFREEYSDDQSDVYTFTPEDYQNAIDCGGYCN